MTDIIVISVFKIIYITKEKTKIILLIFIANNGDSLKSHWQITGRCTDFF